jgi:hypothetical protein
VTENVINNFFLGYLGTDITRQEYFTIGDRENASQNNALQLICLLVKKFIWDCKLSESLPDPDFLKNFVKFELRAICKIKREVSKTIASCGLNQDFINDCTNL